MLELILSHIWYIVATFVVGVMVGWLTYDKFKTTLGKLAANFQFKRED